MWLSRTCVRSFSAPHSATLTATSTGDWQRHTHSHTLTLREVHSLTNHTRITALTDQQHWSALTRHCERSAQPLNLSPLNRRVNSLALSHATIASLGTLPLTFPCL